VRALIFSILTLPCLGASFGAAVQAPVLPFEARGSEYLSRGSGFAVSVTPARELLVIDGHAVSLSAVGANRNASLEPLDRMPGRANYFIGPNTRSYDLYGRLRWRNVYPGIDAIFHANREYLEYDFEIAAQRNPSRIQLAFSGADRIQIAPDGDLVLTAGARTIRQPRPVGYQMIAGQRRLVDVAYRLDASNHLRFRTGAYNRTLPLIIDPQIVFDKTFGGSGQTTVLGMARDAQGNLYVTGSTNSTDFGATSGAFQPRLGTAPLIVTSNAGQSWSFPTLPGAVSVFSIASAPSSPSTFYASTPIGIFQSTDAGITWKTTPATGLAGPATTLAVDFNSANIVYAGTAQNLYVSTDGAMTFRPASDGISGQGIACIGPSPTQPGTVFVSVQNPPAVFRSADSGQTWTSVSFPVALEGPVEPILFTSSGAIVAAAYEGIMISIDSGNTWTPGAAVHADNNQGLAISLNSNILYLLDAASSRLERSTDGGLTFNAVQISAKFSFEARIAVDPKNPSTVYVADYNILYRSTDSGQTWSQLSLPYTINPQTIFVSPVDSRVFIGAFTQTNAFVTKWSPDGSQVLYATYVGGSGADQSSAIAVDPLGDAFITGYTTSPNFPTTNGAILSKLTTAQDIFVAKLSADGSQLLYSTLLGSQSANAYSIAVDVNGSAAITGSAGTSFPVTGGAFQTSPLNGCTVVAPLAGFITTGSAFVSRLQPNGQGFIFSTLFGGSCATHASNVAIDAGGNVWVVGSTISPDFPVTSDALQPKLAGGVGYYDGFLTRFTPTGQLGYSTYIGGTGYDAMSAIAFDVPGNIYLTGESGGLLVPQRPGYQPQVNAFCYAFGPGPAVFEPMGNGIILKLDPAAQIIEGLTYLGAPGCLDPSSIAVDSNLNVWVAGNLNTPNPTPQTVSPVQIGGQGFVSKFSPDLTQLLFSTYFDSVAGLALDSSGLAYVAGSRQSSAQTAYVAKIDPTPPTISIDSITSPDPHANPGPRGISAGEVIQLNGTNIGPAASTPGVIQQGFLSSNVSGVQVTFDGVAIPLLSVSAGQIELVTPFELAGKSKTTIQVQYNGSQSNPVQVPVDSADVQILGVFNADFTPNSQSNPAAPNSNMTLYVAGLGNTSPPSQDGQINGFPLASTPMPVQVEWFANQPVTSFPVTYAGAAFGLAAGIYQINFVAPPQTVQGLELVLGNSIVASFNVFVSQ